ncbi:ribosome biogenesis protein Nop53/GLTSCR2 [Crepidotus variabilis]|uniref:Ribosome biogenesis protein NOP53 n=1 Tax=Crepidotus variabilis TaxID=179855 RepID=A0A9P6JT45_9AGAR|nr:ribosome biogenesis protein Nop53/GLTSCR2 [Crepidotus variabilis]
MPAYTKFSTTCVTLRLSTDMSSTLSQKRKSNRSTLGAPSQHNQSSRKGKKSWRKNVNIEDLEERLEGLRAEERVIGKSLQKTSDTDLFQIDVKGDEQIRKSLPRYSTAQLTSSKILAQRSAVPAVFSRTSSGSTKRKAAITREDKERMLRVAKRPRKGPFNSILDPSEYASGSTVFGLSEAVKTSGAYDPWAAQPPPKQVKDGLETVEKRMPKAPVVAKTTDLIDIPAVVEPHQGTSYNPPVLAHHELLLKAASVEEKRVQDAEKLAEVRTKMAAARIEEDEQNLGVAKGMTVQKVDDEDEDTSAVDQETIVKAASTRKTKSQRHKASKLLEEKRTLAQKAERKRLLASVSDAKIFKRATTRLLTEQEERRQHRRLMNFQKLQKQGLVGQKLGKHKIPDSSIDVQLGEDLTENLRGLKPEGNLFRDRFLSMQQRALIEPRARVMPKKRRHRYIEYEKHAWKRFE